jgi:hypothetical protein
MKIVAYGSLMNQASLESVVGLPAPLSKIIVPGWKRVFNAPFDRHAYLNIVPAVDTAIEAAYFELDPARRRRFDEREAGADLVEVIPGFYAFVWPEADCRQLPVLRSYLDACSQAAADLGIDFAVGLDWPRTVVDDTKNPQYDILYWEQDPDEPGETR